MKRALQFALLLKNRSNRLVSPVKNLIIRQPSNKLVNISLNIGPGPQWRKPSQDWLSVDIDPKLGDIVANLCEFSGFPLNDSTVQCIYASHVCEHISLYKTQLFFNECFRVLKPNGYLRIIVPDVCKSMEEYLKGKGDFMLFARRRERAKVTYGEEYTLFECLKEDFISRSGQPRILGKYALAHQNAFDHETLEKHLIIAGFDREKIYRSDFRQSRCPDFSFEGEYESEANEHYRSLYVECVK